MAYHYLTTSAAGFVQQLVLYVTKGYYFYVTGEIPDGKDPLAVDRKLIERYDVALSKWQRYRRRGQGEASVQYLRYGRFFVLVATHGRHRFFEEERQVFRSCKEAPIVFRGYSISHRRGRTHVRIRMEEYRRLKEYFVRNALRRDVAWWEQKFRAFPFECYAPVRNQTFFLYRAVNRARKVAGLPLIDWRRCIRTKRRPVRPFDGSSLHAPYLTCSGEADRSSAGTQLRKE